LTFNIPMKNCLPTLSHWSFDPLCLALFTLHAIVGDTNQKNSHKGILLIIQHLWQSPTMIPQLHFKWWLNLGFQWWKITFYHIMTFSKDNQYNKKNLLCCYLCKWCCLMFNIRKTMRTNLWPHVSLNAFTMITIHKSFEVFVV